MVGLTDHSDLSILSDSMITGGQTSPNPGPGPRSWEERGSTLCVLLTANRAADLGREESCCTLLARPSRYKLARCSNTVTAFKFIEPLDLRQEQLLEPSKIFDFTLKYI